MAKFMKINATDVGKYTHKGNKPDGDAPTERIKAEQIINTKHTIVADMLETDSSFTTTVISSGQIKKKRGRPKGSKNKTAQDNKIEKIVEHGYTYRATCGCLFTTAIKTRMAQYCKHGNLMNITEQADFTR